MITPFFAFLFSVATWVLAYNIQKRQPAYKVRMGRKVYMRFQRTEKAQVVDMRATNGGYMATFLLSGGTQIHLEADNELLNHASLPFEVFLFENNYSPEGYELPPPAIRYHDTSLNGDDNNGSFAVAWSQVEIINQIRLVLFTTAFVVSFQAPHISSTISLCALFLSIYFVKPISIYTIEKICGIIKTRKEQQGPSVPPAVKTKNTAVKPAPPLPDVASDAEQFIRRVNMRMEQNDAANPKQSSEEVAYVQVAPTSPPIQPLSSSGDGDSYSSIMDEPQEEEDDDVFEISNTERLTELNQGDDPFGEGFGDNKETPLESYSDEGVVYSDEDAYEDVIPSEESVEENAAASSSQEDEPSKEISCSETGSNTSTARQVSPQHSKLQTSSVRASGKKGKRGKKSMTVLEAIQQ